MAKVKVQKIKDKRKVVQKIPNKPDIKHIEKISNEIYLTRHSIWEIWRVDEYSEDLPF